MKSGFLLRLALSGSSGRHDRARFMLMMMSVTIALTPRSPSSWLYYAASSCSPSSWLSRSDQSHLSCSARSHQRKAVRLPEYSLRAPPIWQSMSYRVNFCTRKRNLKPQTEQAQAAHLSGSEQPKILVGSPKRLRASSLAHEELHATSNNLNAGCLILPAGLHAVRIANHGDARDTYYSLRFDPCQHHPCRKSFCREGLEKMYWFSIVALSCADNQRKRVVLSTLAARN